MWYKYGTTGSSGAARKSDSDIDSMRIFEAARARKIAAMGGEVGNATTRE